MKVTDFYDPSFTFKINFTYLSFNKLNIHSNALFADNLKPKKPVDLSVLKKEQEVFDNIDDDDDEEDSDEEEDKDDLDDLADDTELSDDPNAEDDDDDEDDDIYDDDIDWDTTPSSTTTLYKQTSPTTTTTTTTTTQRTTVATPDPYFTHFDPRNEHDSYKEAQVTIISALY